MAANQEASMNAHTDIVASAAAEVATPGADTESQYECPFCVMMRKGGCEEVFKAFMECGEKADKGDQQMAECLPQFEQLHLCMEKNKAVFDGLLQEMKDEEEKNKAAAGASSSSSDAAVAAGDTVSSTAGTAAATTLHQEQDSRSSPSSSGAHVVQHSPAVPEAAAGGMATAS